MIYATTHALPHISLFTRTPLLPPTTRTTSCTTHMPPPARLLNSPLTTACCYSLLVDYRSLLRFTFSVVVIRSTLHRYSTLRYVTILICLRCRFDCYSRYLTLIYVRYYVGFPHVAVVRRFTVICSLVLFPDFTFLLILRCRSGYPPLTFDSATFVPVFYGGAFSFGDYGYVHTSHYHTCLCLTRIYRTPPPRCYIVTLFTLICYHITFTLPVFTLLIFTFPTLFPFTLITGGYVTIVLPDCYHVHYRSHVYV